jgi:hypothetical protein
MSYFNVLSDHISGENEKNYKNFQVRIASNLAGNFMEYNVHMIGILKFEEKMLENNCHKMQSPPDALENKNELNQIEFI